MKAIVAPPSASRFAIAHAIERLLATPSTSARFPSNIRATLLGFGYPAVLSRRLALLTLTALLATPSAASAAFRPIKRDLGETSLPRLRAGTLNVPTARERGRVTVVVRLGLPPLAAWSADRGLSSSKTGQRLDVASRAARTHLARISAAQRAAVAQLRTAIPQARVQQRYRVLLDGFAVNLPQKKLPQLARMSFATSRAGFAVVPTA